MAASTIRRANASTRGAFVIPCHYVSLIGMLFETCLPVLTRVVQNWLPGTTRSAYMDAALL